MVIEREFSTLHKQFEIVNYEGAGHSFFSVDRPGYRVVAATAGWAKIFEFLDSTLQS